MTDADLNRLWDAIDIQRKDLAAMATGLAVMGEQMRGMRDDMKAHVRPCEDFRKHLEAHVKQDEEAKQTWREVALRIITPICYAAGGAIAALIGIETWVKKL
jgi:hypothetical protein